MLLEATILPARHYVSAVCATVFCLSVCLSAKSRRSVETGERIRLIFDIVTAVGFPTVFGNGIWLSPKQILPSGTLCQTLHL